MEVVVLGMHSGGTSLVSGMLHAMGVNMYGNDKMGPIASSAKSIYGYDTHEDADFVRKNAQILADAGGDWRNPPNIDTIMEKEPDWRNAIRELVERKRVANEGTVWGWKDPRTALTVGLYNRHLRNPLYVCVLRERKSLVKSLLRRRLGTAEFWEHLTDAYYGSISRFLASFNPKFVCISYDGILDPLTQDMWVRQLAHAVFGYKHLHSHVEAAKSVIRQPV